MYGRVDCIRWLTNIDEEKTLQNNEAITMFVWVG